MPSDILNNPLISLIFYSVTPHQPKIAALSTRWAEFYREFLSFEQTYRNLDIEMSNLNPYLNDMAAVKVQLEKLKVCK